MATRKDILQRLALLAALFVLTYVGVAFGDGGWPDILTVLVMTFGASTLLWVLDPAFQHLYGYGEDEDEKCEEERC